MKRAAQRQPFSYGIDILGSILLSLPRFDLREQLIPMFNLFRTFNL